MTGLTETVSTRLSERQAAEYLGIKQRTLADWRLRATCLPYTKLGRRVVYQRSDLDALLAAGRIEPKVSP